MHLKNSLVFLISCKTHYPSTTEILRFRAQLGHIQSHIENWALSGKSDAKLYLLAQEVRHIQSLIVVLELYSEIEKARSAWSSRRVVCNL